MHDIYRVCFDEGFVGVVLLAMTEKYKIIIRLTFFASLQTRKKYLNYTSMGGTMRSVGGMLSFWAGGISSFFPCAREYRGLLRRPI